MFDFTLNNPAIQSYIIYSAILAVKLMALAPLTATVRVWRGSLLNPEDAKIVRGKVKHDDPVVERIRRAHLNDLENIPAFWVLGALYLTTGPVTAWATLLYRVFAASRIIHTIVYAIIPLPQPTRGLTFVVTLSINVYMAVQVIMHYSTAI